MKTAQTEAFRELVDEIRKNAFLKDQLVSLIVFGSFIRGDIIEKQSGLDIYGVFNKMSKETISKLTELIEKHVKIKYRVLDFACSNLEELDAPLTKGFPFKFLISDQIDFRQHHLVLYGNEIMGLIPVYTWNETKRARVNRQSRFIRRTSKESNSIIHMNTGLISLNLG